MFDLKKYYFRPTLGAESFSQRGTANMEKTWPAKYSCSSHGAQRREWSSLFLQHKRSGLSYDPATEKWTLVTENAFANGRTLARFAFQYGNNKTLAIVPFYSGAHALYDMKGLKVLATIEDTKSIRRVRVSILPKNVTSY